MQTKLRTFLLVAAIAGSALASTPGACTLPNPNSTEPMKVNDACRGAVVTATPGTIYMVALNATPGNQFTDMRFIIQFGAVENGLVRAYYTWLDARVPYILATINGKRYGSSMVELHVGLLPIGSILNIQALNVQINQTYSSIDRYIGWAMRF